MQYILLQAHMAFNKEDHQLARRFYGHFLSRVKSASLLEDSGFMIWLKSSY